MICEIQILNDYFELIVGVLTLGALIAVIYQIWNEKKERKQDVADLKAQTKALQDLASSEQEQTQQLIAINSNLEIQNTKQIAELKIISERLGDEAEGRKRSEYFEREQRRADIMPHFFPKLWGINDQSLNLTIENRGETAIDLSVPPPANAVMNPFNSVRIEKNQRVDLKGRPTSFAQVQGMAVPGRTPMTIKLLFDDVDHNHYRQVFDFPNGMEQQPFFSEPDLIERAQTIV